MVELMKDIVSFGKIRLVFCLTILAVSFTLPTLGGSKNGSSNFTAYFPDGTHKRFKTKNIAGTNYLSIAQAGDILFFEKEYTVENEVLFCQNNYLVALNGSFFFDFSKHCQSYTVQIFMPIKQHNGVTYLPCEEFISASIRSGVLNARFENKELKIEQYSLVEKETYDFNTFDSPGIPLIAESEEIPNAGTYKTHTKSEPSILSSYTIKQLQIRLPAVEPNYEEMLKLKYEYRKSKRTAPPNVFQIPDQIKKKDAALNKK
jgi:hypothetical protein